jgi:hypothetical protein
MDDWTPRLVGSDAAGLAAAVEQLFAQQATAWPLLAQGLTGLARARTKLLRIGTASVALRQIPHRLQSTTARVDAASIGARPCFLCQRNLPPEQRGVAIGGDWVALCNPFPILERHLTIVRREHVPQRLAGRIAALLDLARALPGSFVIYNGPECGASAPDHLHFQAADRGLFPLEAETQHREGLLDHPSRPIVLRDADPAALATRIERLMRTLAERAPSSAAAQEREAGSREPLVNLAAFQADGRLTACVFARRKHRPAAFERGELLLSPAAIDLSGVLVAPREQDFERLGAELVASVFDEVMLGRQELAELLERAGIDT